jgi:hypothetical protein
MASASGAWAAGKRRPPEAAAPARNRRRLQDAGGCPIAATHKISRKRHTQGICDTFLLRFRTMACKTPRKAAKPTPKKEKKEK